MCLIDYAYILLTQSLSVTELARQFILGKQLVGHWIFSHIYQD